MSSESPVLADHSADRRMLLLAAMALVVGSGGALGAWCLLKLIALATNLFWFGRWSTDAAAMTQAGLGAWLVLIPVLGSVIVGLMARYGSEKIRGHGIPEAIEAILYGESRLSLKVAILKPLSSAISIGSGGPFGAEGPIIMTGGAIGSLFAQRFSLSAAERKTLLVAGAAAGMTAIFGTPLAAILLALEVLLFEWKPRSLVPVVVAAVTAAAWRPLLVGHGPLFPLAGALPEGAGVLLAAVGIGLVGGALSSALSALLYRIEDGFHRLPVHWMWWPALGAVVVGVGGWFDARVLGAGYDNIQALLDGAMPLHAALALFALKAVVWLIALGSGTSGGVLAPLLIIGGAAGLVLEHALPDGLSAAAGLWALLGMTATLSGGMRAPLMAAVFAAELTGRFDALLCTVVASAASYAVSVLLARRSILTEKIARRGRHIVQEYGIDPHELLQASELMTPAPQTLSGAMTVGEAVRFFGDAARFRSYPVVDGAGRLIGLASRDEALRWREQPDLAPVTLAEQVSDASLPTVGPDWPVGRVADLMLETGAARIPVVAPDTRQVLGMLTRHDLLKARRAQQRHEQR